MMKTSHLKRLGLARFGLTICVALALGAQNAAYAAGVADVEVSSSAIVFYPNAEYAGFTLTISGPGDVYLKRDFAGDVTPLFKITQGHNLPDGQYTYELTASPALTDEEKSALQEARESNIEMDLGLDMSTSGAFSITGGAIVTIQSEEGLLKDQVILDDLIVDGSICVGLDCVNGESFGFDTLRLKENNLRIKFQDTSNSASFPSNDWQITANDSSNGGQNKFSIDDIDGGRTPFTLEAGAPSHSLYVDDGGRVGLGTSTPVVELHVVNGDSPTLRLEQNGSSGFTAQTWDIAGNETNFFVRDVNNGSKLPFKIFPNAPTNSLIIEGSTGDIGIGIQSPTAPVHVSRTNGTAKILVEEKSTSDTARQLLELINNGQVQFRMKDSSQSDDFFWIYSAESNYVISDTEGGTGGGNSGAELTLTRNGDLTITGSLTVGPGGCSGCDLVFSPDYPVESIQDHAAYMWANKHLPGVGPTPEDAPMNLSTKTGGILNELEKAHIYIEQLHKQLQEKNSLLHDIEERLANLEVQSKKYEKVLQNDVLFRARLNTLESIVQAMTEEGTSSDSIKIHLLGH